MKKTILILICIFYSSKMIAQFILAGQHGAGDYFVDVIPDTTIAVSYNGNSLYTLDINGDNIYDLNLEVYCHDAQGERGGHCSVQPLNSNTRIAFGYTDTCFKPAASPCTMSYSFMSDDTIQSNINWWGGLLAYHYEWWVFGYYCHFYTFSNAPMFIGVRLLLPPDTLFGWIKVSGVQAGDGYANLTVEEYACNLNSTAISENSFLQNELTIYPNPFISSATLIINSNIKLENAQLKIFEVTGREISKYEIKNPKTEISRKNLSSGIYFYEVQNKSEIIGTGKLIIQ